MVLVSVPEQVMHVYRNGILIGRSTVSTGSKGHATPGGVFTILEKKQEHYSKKYDNAPMPNMQRLTWTGIAMHSGNLPGYPASHGCIRLPYDFSQLLFSATAKGGTVVVGDGKTPVPHLASNPGLMLAPKDFTPDMLRPLAKNDYDWQPGAQRERADHDGRQRRRQGDLRLSQRQPHRPRPGRDRRTRSARRPCLLACSKARPAARAFWSRAAQARRWMSVTSSGRRADAEKIASRLRMNPEFAAKVYDALAPGTTVIITDQPVVRSRRNAAILES